MRLFLTFLLVAFFGFGSALAEENAETVLANFAQEQHKTVLYLDGSAQSPWFFLGVLYAFESYGVQVDSIVGTSYGALVGALWKSGYSLDDIQRIFRHPDVEPFLSEKVVEQEPDYLPLADSGVASIRARFAFNFDSTGSVSARKLPLHYDSLKLARQKFRLRIEESLYRKPISRKVAVMTCEGALKNGAKEILKTLPFEGNLFGPGCETPFPREGDNNDALIVSAAPLREPANENSRERLARVSTSREINFYKESAIVIRPLALPGKTPQAWIQSGFSETEKKLSALSSVQKLQPYSVESDTIAPWFRLAAAPDSIPSQLQYHLLSYWDERDTGLVAVERFLDRISESSAYENVDVQMQPNGTVLMNASAPVQLDVRGGGFGSNILGAFAFADARVRYVNQFEYELGSSVFYGMGGYGAIPELKLMRLLEGKFNFGIRYEFMQLRPLQSYLNDVPYYRKIYEERRGDLIFTLDYLPNEMQRVSVFARVGEREYELHKHVSKSKVKVAPLSPELQFEQKTKRFDKWFGNSGYQLLGRVGMESVGASFGNGDAVPIFWTFGSSAAANYSPARHFTVGGGASFGANIYREEGEDFPPSFGYEAIDWTIRQGIDATPWSSEWYFPEFRSHEYGLLRLNFGLHAGPFGAWLFGAYVKDFEDSGLSGFSANRLVLEPALRFAYKSLSVYAGLSRTVNADEAKDLGDFANYHYFIRVGNFQF